MDLRRTTTVSALNPVAGDLELDAAGNLVWTDDETGDSTAQRIRIRLGFWRGEYFADTRQGIPYLPDVLGAKLDEATLGALFRGVILSTPGVSTLQSYATTFNGQTREVEIDFVAILESGRTFVSADFGPFLVEL